MNKLWLLLTFIVFPLLGQFIGENPNSGKGIPFFRMNTFRVYQETGAYIVVVSEILYDDLTFERIADNYAARYELTFFVQDEDGEKNLG